MDTFKRTYRVLCYVATPGGGQTFWLFAWENQMLRQLPLLSEIPLTPASAKTSVFTAQRCDKTPGQAEAIW